MLLSLSLWLAALVIASRNFEKEIFLDLLSPDRFFITRKKLRRSFLYACLLSHNR